MIGTLIPSIFLAVTAFPLNVVLNRQVATQREQIAALKVLGYAHAALVAHYLLQVLVIVALGVVIGTGVGWWFGSAVTELYAEFFHFPTYRLSMPTWTIVVAAAVTLAAAVAGALSACEMRWRSRPPKQCARPIPAVTGERSPSGWVWAPCWVQPCA